MLLIDGSVGWLLGSGGPCLQSQLFHRSSVLDVTHMGPQVWRRSELRAADVLEWNKSPSQSLSHQL